MQQLHLAYIHNTYQGGMQTTKLHDTITISNLISMRSAKTEYKSQWEFFLVISCMTVICKSAANLFFANFIRSVERYPLSFLSVTLPKTSKPTYLSLLLSL